jgi:hypothetical protein
VDKTYKEPVVPKNGMSEITYESPAITMKDYEKYRGKHVVIYKNEIISEGSSSVEAVAKALEKHPELKTEDLEITYIPFEETLILEVYI